MALCPYSFGPFFLSFGTMVWYITHGPFPMPSWHTHPLWAFSKCLPLLSPPPGKKAPGPLPAVSQRSSPTANLPGGKAGCFTLGDDDPQLSFTQLTATLATSKEPVSNLRLNFHTTEPFISLIPLHG